MGVANSKRKYSGGPNYSTKRGKEGDDKDADGKGEEKPAETDPDKIKIANMKMWGPVLKSFMDDKEIKTKIKQAADTQSAEGGIFIDKKILFTADDAQAYVSGKESHPLTQYFIDDLDKIYLFKPEFKKILEDLSKGSEGKPVRKMIKVPKEDKDMLTKLIPMILDGPTHILENVKRAVQHKALTEIINYVLASKEFKEHHKGTLTEQRDAIKSGSKSKEEASLELKEKKGEGAAPEGDKAPTEGGSDGGEGQYAGQGDVPSTFAIAKVIANAVAETNLKPLENTLSDGGSASEAESNDGSNNSMSDSASEGADSSSYGGSSDSMSDTAAYDSDGGSELDIASISSTASVDQYGGKLFKTAEEKEDKKFKKAEQAGLEDKKKAFVLDTVKMIKFMDENKDVLLSLYSKATKKSLGMGSNIDKNADKTAAVEALFPVVDAYVKEPDMAGAAGMPPPAEGDTKDGEKKDGEKKDGEKKDGAAADGAAADGAPPAEGAKDGAPAADDADKKADGEAGKKDGGSQDVKEFEMLMAQDGGAKTVPKKKKKFTRKKPQHIKISINVGNQNVIASSSESSSDSSDSDSESDSSDSDSAERKQKYTVNKVKKT